MLSRRCGPRAASLTCSSSPVHGAFTTSLRRYTPIYTPEPSTPFTFDQLHASEERETLWQSRPPVTSTEEGVMWWLRFGNHPVVSTMASPTCSFARIEDHIGTNLISSCEEHTAESTRYWLSYFTNRAARQMRWYRRTASRFVGVLSAASSDEGIKDEADMPRTKWSGDAAFMEMAFLAERHLKQKVHHLSQLERVLWYESEPEAFLAFFDGLQQQSPPHIPLPTPSHWFYEGEARKKWAEQYLPAAKASMQYFKSVLGETATAEQQQQLLQQMADQSRKIQEVQLARLRRQLALEGGDASAGAFADVSLPAPDTPALQRWCESHLERCQRSIEEGELDVEDMQDSSEEWKQEHSQIAAIASEVVGKTTFKDFWLHTIRREELETLHVLTTDSLRDVAASALSRLLQLQSYQKVLEDLSTSIQRGRLDAKAYQFRPYMNMTWCCWHYAKFGGSSIAQHSIVASRRLLYHYAASMEDVAAIATLYYDTKPLSSLVDTSSPFAYRQSLSRLCGTYGVHRMRALQRPLFSSAAFIAEAEQHIHRVCQQAAVPFGLARRQQKQERQQLALQKGLVQPLTNVEVHPLLPELLEGEATEEEVRTPLPLIDTSRQVQRWPAGGKMGVSFRLPESGAELTPHRRAEVTLWRRSTPEERETVAKAAFDEKQAVQQLLDGSPALREVDQYAKTFFARVSGEAAARSEGESTEWVFEGVLKENARPTPSPPSSVVVMMPFVKTEGTYRLRVRLHEDGDNVEKVPQERLYREAFSAEFEVYDALSGALKPFTKVLPSGLEVIPSESWLACCRALREAGVEVPLHCEFEAGQVLTPAGEVAAQHFLTLLAKNVMASGEGEWRTEAEASLLPSCRAHWDVWHPGATEEEWASARHDELTRAVMTEREWWWKDALLLPSEQGIPGMSGGINTTNADSVMDYGMELTSLLTASSSSHDAPTPVLLHEGNRPLIVTASATVNGCGEVRNLEFSTAKSAYANADEGPQMDEVLAAALTAIRKAQDRHATLSMTKLAPVEKELQAVTFCGVDGMEMGGKYGRTWCRAMEMAKEALRTTQEAGRSVPDSENAESERRVEDTQVDRFASSTHPEQRKTRFVNRTTASGWNMEETTPDQESTWGR